jgi:hypothetical protein
VGAELLEAGMAVAERRLVEPAAESREDVADDDLPGRPGEGVAARLAPGRPTGPPAWDQAAIPC